MSEAPEYRRQQFHRTDPEIANQVNAARLQDFPGTRSDAVDCPNRKRVQYGLHLFPANQDQAIRLLQVGSYLCHQLVGPNSHRGGQSCGLVNSLFNGSTLYVYKGILAPFLNTRSFSLQ